MEAQTYHVVTANLLVEGLVVFLGDDGDWTADINACKQATSADELKQMEAQGEASVETQTVVGSYAIEVTVLDDKSVRPVLYRERIRAYGPSSHKHFGRGDNAEHYKYNTDNMPVHTNGV